jgi:hypothetical protein
MRPNDPTTRVLCWASGGAAVGVCLFGPLFLVTAPKHSPEFLLWITFAIMGAIPVAVMAALFGAFRVLQEELASLRREIVRLQGIEERLLPPASTQFKSGPPQQTPS